MENELVASDLIESLKSKRGSWNRQALAYLGVDWPPLKGWKHRIIGYKRRPLSNALDTAAEVMASYSTKRGKGRTFHPSQTLCLYAMG